MISYPGEAPVNVWRPLPRHPEVEWTGRVTRGGGISFSRRRRARRVLPLVIVPSAAPGVAVALIVIARLTRSLNERPDADGEQRDDGGDRRHHHSQYCANPESDYECDRQPPETKAAIARQAGSEQARYGAQRAGQSGHGPLTHLHRGPQTVGVANVGQVAPRQNIRHATQAGDEVMARRFVGALAISVLYGPTPAEEGAAYCEEVLSRAVEDRKASAITEVALAHLEAMRGNFEAARARYRQSRALLEEFGWRHLAALTSLDSAPVEMLAGDLGAAEHELRKDHRTLEQMGERNYISTTTGMLAEVLYRQGRYQESADLASSCRELASPDDVASQFLWRCVQAKLLARDRQHERSDAVLTEALDLIGGSDWLDWQGNGLMDLAELRRLGGRIADAVEALAQASARFTEKGNVVSARRADELADALRATLAGPSDAPDAGSVSARSTLRT